MLGARIIIHADGIVHAGYFPQTGRSGFWRVQKKVVADDLFFFPQCNGELFPSRREADVAAINVVRLLDGIDAAKETRCWSVGAGAAQVAETISAVISNEVAGHTAMAGSHKVPPRPTPPRPITPPPPPPPPTFLYCETRCQRRFNSRAHAMCCGCALYTP